MASRLLAGVVRALLPTRARRRMGVRRRALRLLSLVGETGSARAIQVDEGAGGLGVLVLGRAALLEGALVPVLSPAGVRPARVAHTRRLLPGLWRVGLEVLPAPVAAEEPRAYLAG
jgi:cellulose synthase (UDP-forming)